MKQDKHLKEILLNSAERASGDFTDVVMKKVNGLSAAPLSYQPLVSPKLQRLFVFTFAASVTAILGLCLIIAVSHLQFVNWIQNWEFPHLNYNKILIFILSFWIVFAINSLIEKKVLSRTGSSF